MGSESPKKPINNFEQIDGVPAVTFDSKFKRSPYPKGSHSEALIWKRKKSKKRREKKRRRQEEKKRRKKKLEESSSAVGEEYSYQDVGEEEISEESADMDPDDLEGLDSSEE